MKHIIIKQNDGHLRLLSFISIALIALYSCTNGGKKVTAGGVTYMSYNVRQKDTVYLDIRGSKYKHLGDVPDSLRTAEQQKLIQALNDVILNGVAVEDNMEILKFSKEECLARGLTLKYYKELQNNIRTNNSFNKAHGIKNVAEMKASLDSAIRGTVKR